MKTTVRTEDIKLIIIDALKKYQAGRAKYGELNLATDKRDFTKEAIEELLDCINYCCFAIVKLRKAENRR